MKITCSKSSPPLGGLIVAEHVKALNKTSLEVTWGTETTVENISCKTSNDVARAIAKLFCQQIYGTTAIETTEVDHWLTFALGPLSSKNDFSSAINVINKALGPVTYLANKRLTIADFIVFAALYVNRQWQDVLSSKSIPVNVLRWYNFMNSQEAVKNALNSLTPDLRVALTPSEKTRQSVEKSTVGNRAREGKFVELPGAEMGKVVVRFPPEASGYLHIGHAKAALLNQYYQDSFQGKLIMRFDDTNPAKENVHFEKVILEDVAMLDIKPDMFTHTSQYFDLMLEYCEKLIREGKAYVDDTEAELMKTQREQKIESANRSNSMEKNLKLWEEMKKGTAKGQQCCVRAKIDMQSPNGCLRDPTIYRCKNEPHPRTGDKYKVYPTYDFACPIVDSIEGVTHTLRTMEYHDRDPQFYWFIEAMGLRKPYIWEYSRLSMTNTVLSKRKLTWFVSEGLVDGWDDPRMPTVRGVLRRGMTVQGLKEFIIAQGSSRSVVFMEWDKIWAFNKKVIDPIAPRYTAVEDNEPVPIFVKGVKAECMTVPKHPKNSEVGTKEVWVAPKILIDRVDAESLKEGENATFINWGNLLIKKINRENDKITSIEADPNIENKDYKKTLKLTWLAEVEKAPFTPTWCVYFDHIISKAILGKDEDFKQYIGHETRREVQMLGDPELKNLKKGEIIQLQRRGFFKVDVAYEPLNLSTCREQSVVLFSIPDGHVNENPLCKPTASVKAAPEKENKKASNKETSVPPSAAGQSPAELNAAIIRQGDIVRKLKEQKAAKEEIEKAVKSLLALKTDYKKLTDTDWKPGCTPPTAPPSNGPVQDANGLSAKIAAQGEKVRKIKSEKAEKSVIEGEVKVLLNLKSEYKQLTGKDWTPDAVAAPVAPVKQESSSTDESGILQKIASQGDKVRDLKAKKATKAEIEAEVKSLLSLKTEYKSLTGKDWKPGAVPSSSSNQSQEKHTQADENTILQMIAAQGEKVRDLKSKKADKATVETEVKILLAYKADYKSATGKDWKPGTVAQPPITAPTSINENEQNNLLIKIKQQGDKVRQLKAEKAEKSIIDAEVKQLVQLKADFKALTGKDWKPDMVPVTDTNSCTKEESGKGDDSKETLTAKITEQGNIVRDLKAKKASKDEVDAAVKILLDLKAEYKNVTGNDFPAATRAPAKTKDNKPDQKEKVSKQKPAAKEKKPADGGDGGMKKQTRLGLEAKKEENLSDWYSQVITKGEMIEYYDVSGCYIFRPWSYSIWEFIKDWFDGEIKKLGVQNCYFPIFVSKRVLETEKTHIADFAPEVAWVTKSGESEMAEPVAVRPTSETVMYPAYAKWIQSYRDLPIKLNQWNNVVRWEFKHPQPFLRTREFLWQEGHTAYALKEEATEEVGIILDLYARIYSDLLAIPVIKGRKTEKEKFAGSDYSFTVEAFVSASGRGIQGATSHHLGKNFSKMFEIVYEDPETQEKKYVFQNSWGITTRTIGVMIMIHADNQGLVLPPKVACIQIVIVPCGISVNLSDEARNNLQAACDQLKGELKNVGIRVKGDYRSNYSPGWKFNDWELKGVPIRVELGPKDIEKKQIVAVRRDTGEKVTLPRDSAAKKLNDLLGDIQSSLYNKASKDLEEHTILMTDWSQFGPSLDKKNIILAPFCGDNECEDKIKNDSTRDEGVEPGAPSMGAKSLCIPLEQPATIKENDKCIHPDCTRKPQFYTLFGRSY
ncbi:bifunctional glutamate/proline--tRNA ligase [Anoplophora glabripennis]|uniref:bifunctional glutamate/proline--tRNA ligase n=1 Tax=Anoplophora glabripennis TaxID=217634 RepID=UPI0008753F05|nr:bifunctional glutamate/proline--tRNA ligase [Anoplophora glabripennis]